MARNKLLPISWEWVKIAEIADTTSGGTPLRSHSEYYQGNIPWIKSGELNNSIILEAEEAITEIGLSKSSAKLFPKNTVVVALYGATVGKTGILGFDASTNQAVCAIFPRNYSFLPKYMFYWIQSQRQNLISLSMGGAQPNISQGVIRSLDFPLAPLPEQERIVAKIEELFTQLDAGEAALKRIHIGLKRYKASLLKAAVEGKLAGINQVIDDKLPLGWRWVTIEELAKPERNSIKRGPFGSTVKKSYFVPVGYKIYEQQNVIQNDFSIGTYFIDMNLYYQLRDFRIVPGDLLITGAGTIGKLAVVPEGIMPGIINQALLKISLNRELVDTNFFIYYFEVKLREFLLAKTRGSAMQNLSSIKDLKLMMFLLPPLMIQKRIVTEVEQRLSLVLEVESGIEAQLKKSARLRQSILKRAFEGKLVAQNPDDEPQPILPDRITRSDEMQESQDFKQTRLL